MLKLKLPRAFRDYFDKETIEKQREINDISAFPNFFGSLCAVVISFLLLINLYRHFAYGGNAQYYALGLRDVLNILHNLPSVDMSWLNSFQLWGESLVSIPLIGNGLAFLVNIVSVGIWTAVGVLQMIYFVIHLFASLV